MATPEQLYTDADARFAADVIRGFFNQNGGQHHTEIFYAICETGLEDAAEVILVDQTTDRVLMTQRAQDDPYFPAGMWHIPGSMVAKKDIKGPHPHPHDNTALRVLSDEIGMGTTQGVIPLSPRWMPEQPRITPRGAEIAHFYGGYLIGGEPPAGQLFSADNLPENMFEPHRAVIAMAPEILIKAFSSQPIIA